jgi:hypothetical protein
MPFLTLTLCAVLLAPIPKPMETLEAGAEDLDDAVVAHDWAKVGELIAELDRSAKELDVSGFNPGQLSRVNEALGRTHSTALRKDALATRRAANELSAAVTELFADYQPKVPVDVMRLDPFLRAVELDGIAHDVGEARRDYASAELVWAALRIHPKVAEAPEARRRVDAQLSRLKRTIDRANFAGIQRFAKAALEGVDQLERLF